MDSLGALTAFVRAAETRSFTAAGRQLGVSSSAIGKAIARLEERLGVRLFHRSTRSITLTQEGKLFLDSCRRIFSEIEAVELEFAQTKGEPKGKLQISLPVIGMLMMPTIAKFMQAFPKVELDIEFADILVDVIDGGYDLVVRTGGPTDSRLMARVLGSFRLELVGSPDYFARAGMPAKPEDLVHHVCLHHRFSTTGKLQPWPFADKLGEVALPVSSTFSTVEALVSAAELGVGIVCVPDFSVRRQVGQGSLVTILSDQLDFHDVFRAVWPSSRFMSPKLRVFIDFLAENLFQSAPFKP